MFRERIFKIFDNKDGVLVFPTENVARYYMSEYVRERKCTIDASFAISFDTFASLFSPSHKDEAVATRFHRIAFVSSFMEKYANKLTYFYNPAFPESTSRFIPFFVSILPSIKLKNRGLVRQKALLNDLDLLYKHYVEFLSMHKLFEPNYEEYKVPDEVKNNKYYLIGYDAEVPMQMLYKELGEPSFIERITLEVNEKREFYLYNNEKAELLSIFDKIYKLREEGVNKEDIILSSPDVERLRPYIERVALDRAIPISFVSEVPLSKTLPGSFLTLIENIYSEDFSFVTLERLLLNSALPYTDEVKKSNRALINFMIDNNIIRGSKYFSSSDPLFSALLHNRELKAHYSAIKSGIVNLFSASDGSAATKALHALTEHLFSSTEFLSTDESDDRAIFSFILNQMNNFSSTVSSLGVKISSFFSLFLADLDNTNYVRQRSEEGVKIYSYKQAYLLDAPYHFVFALSDKNSRVSVRENNFLKEYELEESPAIDVTEALLNYYQSLSRNAYLSGSRETYDGTASAPAFYSSANKCINSVYTGDGKSEYAMRQRSFKAAKNTAFKLQKPNESLGLSLSLPFNKDIIQVSYSTLEDYLTCPFMASIRLFVNMNENRSNFVPATMDHLKIGSFLHNTIQTFLNRYKGVPLLEASKDKYKEELLSVFNSLLKEEHFDYYTELFIINNYTPSLNKFIDDTLSTYPGFTFLGDETRLTSTNKEEGYLIKGFTDTIAESEGNTIVIDYKKGKAKEKLNTYQLLLYKKLLKTADNVALRRDANILLYFGFDKGECGYARDKHDEEDEVQLDEQIERVVTGYKEGIWKYTDNSKNCENCAMRSICRKRFFIK